MFIRVIQFTGARDVEGGLEFIRDTVAPLLHQQKGFRGTTASVDRANGALGVLTLWETEADRDASESALAKSRDEGSKIIGGTMTVEHFEQVVSEIGGIPSVGSRLLLQRVSMDPVRVDENLDYFRQEVLPRIKAQPGWLALRHMVNRETGEAVVGTVWADDDALRAGLEDARSRRPAVADRVTFGEQSIREIAFMDLG